jgi:hypothetical protein
MYAESPDSRRIIASIRLLSIPSIPALSAAEIIKADADVVAVAVLVVGTIVSDLMPAFVLMLLLGVVDDDIVALLFDPESR